MGVPGSRRVTVLTLVAAVVLAGPAPGCSAQNCNLVDWDDGLSVSMTSEQPLTAGTYRLFMELPHEVFELELKVKAPDNTEEGVFASERLVRGHWQVNASLSGSDAFGTLGRVSVGRFKGETGGPESLLLTVHQDGSEVGRLELDEIAYEESEPNGRGCGVAKTASASMELTPRQ